ncbi:MAG TPA: DEAD/DEAH box helicase [Spirochaetota bacterium]|nr:DEAD/DEAH box helicase [Spirochaetota bacterium]
MENNQFTKFKLNDKLIQKLNERRITIPTKIQEDVIPKIFKGENVIAQSKTGTGKTLSYLLPVIEKNIKGSCQTIIIAPTKELANQIYQEALYYTKDLDLKVFLLTGGEEIEKQELKLKNSFDIIVGVTGRILKIHEDNKLKLSGVKQIILDEADFLVELGFISDLEKIIGESKRLEELLVFSATMSTKTKNIVANLNPKRNSSRIDAKMKLPENITNYFFPLKKDEERDKYLMTILKNINPYLCIIFVRTKKESTWLYNILKENRYLVGVLNGELTPSQRKNVMEDFKSTKIQYLVATDVASRGVDVEGINYVINYNLPLNELDYLHRAGRTGRVEDKGVVYTLCNELDEGYLRKYAINLGFDIKPLKISGNTIVEVKNYKGVKARFNIEELKKQDKLKEIGKKDKEKREKYNEQKKRRNTKRR